MGLKESGLRGSLRNVSVGIDAIPDVIDYRWPADEGSGQTVAASVGDVDISLDFDRWVGGNQYNGGQAVNTESGDTFVTESRIQLTGTEFTAAVWTDGLNITGTFASIMHCGSSDGADPTSDEIVDGWLLGFDNTNGQSITVGYVDDQSFSRAIDDASLSVDATQDHLLWVLVGDGNNADVYVYDESELKDHVSGSASRGTQTDGFLGFNGSGGDFVEGPYDDMSAAENTAMSESEIDELHEVTGPNA